MSIYKIIGEAGYTLVGKRKGWNKDSGRTTILEYEGPREPTDAFMETLVNTTEVDALDFGSKEGLGTLTVTYADDDGSGGGKSTVAYNDYWEMISQDIEKPIRSFGGLPELPTDWDASYDLSAMLNTKTQQEELQKTLLYFETAGKDGVAPAGEPMETYYNLLCAGQTHYIRTAIIIRHNLIVGPRTLETASWTGVDRAWTLLGEPGSPELRTTGDAAMIGAITNLPGYDAGRKQWLKRGPQIRQIAKRRFQISTDWWFAENWSFLLYNGTNVEGNP